MSFSKEIYTKLPKTSQEHLVQLEERGLVIPDKERAVIYLTHIGYYRLSAYLIPFETKAINNRRTHVLKSGATFSEILDLYIFDRKLRILVMEAIERIEVSIRSNWANSITLSSNNSHAYIDESLFRSSQKHQDNLSAVKNSLSRSKEAFIQHYQNNYTEPELVPTWVMVEVLTFGELSKWFENTSGIELKKNIITSIGLPPAIEVAESVLQCLSLIRNICAHHGRLWNRKLVKQLPYIKRFQEEMIFEEVETKNGMQMQPSRKLYNYLLVIDHLMNTIQPNTSWSKRLDELITTLPTQQHKEMGIPNNWKGFSADFVAKK